MASSGKKKTTMAKLNREAKMREKRLDKQARKEARKYAAAHPEEAAAAAAAQADEHGETVDSDVASEPEPKAEVAALADASSHR